MLIKPYPDWYYLIITSLAGTECDQAISWNYDEIKILKLLLIESLPMPAGSFIPRVGNILEQDLGAIYDFEADRRYRLGSAACGGCRAVVYGMGLDPAGDLDPYCFIKSYTQRA